MPKKPTKKKKPAPRRTATRRTPRRLDPTLRGFIDRAIVPLLLGLREKER